MSDLVVAPDEMPAWLNAEFFREMLEISGHLELHSVKFACAKGDNFASRIHRVLLDHGDGKMQSVVVKSRPDGVGAVIEDFVKKFSVFPKEMRMYEHIDRFEKIFSDMGHLVTFAPRCLKVTDSPTEILIIEDLSAKGFRMAKKSEGLNFNEMQIVLKKLAQFHAASVVHLERHGEYESRFARGVYNADMKEIFEMHYESNFTFIVDEIFSTWPGLDKAVIAKMKNWRDYILEELIRTMAMKPDEFNVLCHGDAWIANILLQYDSDEQPIDAQFIDFQQSVYTSPAIDLINLIFSSAQIETKFQYFEAFVKFYHKQLEEALKILGSSKQVPMLKKLYLDILDRCFLAVWLGIANLPSCLAENVEDASTDNQLGDNEAGRNYKTKIYNSERYRNHMTELLTYFDKRGLVDLC